ncbi:GNAT family N-acetyltransferase [Rhodalgimonas zhirmunskyi]|uniref:GNAT family N-acetyltransferase n=1 Tax=Rhodalgimonas zhirmunskyi TaxID=2964767 RepID=A0AAJ1X651_9RHOB|nr:GNAT family N-acetyltransferase [Rhodoalgimonas zhirmunskyi]MDQ2094819.1 GNAT family N-acetyltransferase [Rhodoalgimonas zhirmunskyi]
MIRLSPIAPDEAPRLAHLDLGEGQENFSLPPAVALAQDGPFDGYAIWNGDEIVGFFRIDRAYADHMEFCPAGDIGLRAFSIGSKFQGRGFATSACRQIKAALAPRYPNAHALWLTVNCANPVAIAAYRSGGFDDTGALYHGGRAGPQHILRLALS